MGILSAATVGADAGDGINTVKTIEKAVSPMNGAECVEIAESDRAEGENS